MAYIDQKTGTNQKATVMIAVALLQGAAIVALVNGLAVKFFDRPAPTRTAGEQIRIAPPPDPQPHKPAKSPERNDSRTKPIETLVQPGNNAFDDTIPQAPPGGGTVIGDPFAPPPDPPLPPPLAPRAPSPLGKPGTWATADDYPARDLREGNQGVTGFRLGISAKGEVESCAITRSSGFARLDHATCRSLARRARFAPATDGNGKPVAGEYASSIRWVIPE